MRRSRAIIASGGRCACAACGRGSQRVDSLALRVSRYGEESNRRPTGGAMNTNVSLARIAAALSLFAAIASAQVPVRPPYGPGINLETAKKVAAGAVAEAKKNNWNMAI